MPGRKRAILISAFLVSLLFVCFFIVPGLILQHVTGTSFLREPLIQGVESAYAVRVHMGSIAYSWGLIELRDLRITTRDGRPLVNIPITRVAPAWGRLLTGRGQGAAAVHKIELIEPTLYLERDEEERWNIMELLGEDNTPKNASWPELTLRVRDGKVLLPADIEGVVTGDVHRLDAEVRLDPRRRMKWQARFQSSRDLTAWGWSEGSYDASSSSGKIGLRVRDLSLALVEDTLRPQFNHLFDEVSGMTGRCSIETEVGIVKNALDFGTASIRLRQAGIRWDKMPAPIEGIEGEIEASLQSIQVKNLRGRIGDARVRIHGHGDLSEERAKGSLSIQTHRFDLGLLHQLHPLIKSFDVSGQVDARLRVDGFLDDPQIRGEIRLRNGAGIEPKQGWELSHVNALLRLDQQGVDLRSAQGQLNGVRWNASGTVGIWKDPQWKLTFGFKDLNLKRFVASLPFSATPISGRGRLHGPLRTPTVTWDIKAPGLSWNGIDGRNGRIEGSYNTQTSLLTIAQAGFGVNKGRLGVQGEAVLAGEERRFQAVFHGEDLDIEELPLQTLVGQDLPRVGGVVDIELKGSGQLGNWETLRLTGRLDGRKGYFFDNAFHELSADFSYKKKSLSLESFNISQGKGRMIASGTVANGNFKGDAVFNKFDLRHRDAEGIETSTTVSGSIRLEKNETKGFLGSGWMDLESLRRNGALLGDARLKIKTQDDRIILEDSVVTLNHGSRIEIGGAIVWEKQKEPVLDLRLSTPRLTWQTLETVLPLKTRVEIDAKIQGELKVTGPLFSPAIQGRLQSTRPMVAGRRFDGLETEFLWSGNVLHLSKATLRHENGLMVLRGDIIGEQMELKVNISDFPLRVIDLELGGVPVQGRMNAEGTVGGELTHPSFEGRIRGEQVNLGGLIIQHTEGGLAWENGELIVDDLAIERGNQRLRVMGTVAMAEEPTMDLRVKMEATRLNELLLIVGLRPEIPMDGLISGQLKLGGPLSDPEARLLALLEGGYIHGYDKIHGELDLEAKGSEIIVHTLRIADTEGRVDASGEYTPGKKLKIKANIDNFSIAPIVHPRNDEKGLDGRLDLQVDLTANGGGLKGNIVGRLREGKYRDIFLPLTEFNGGVQDDVIRANLSQKDIGLSLEGEGSFEPEWLSFLKLPARKSRAKSGIHWQLKAPHIDATLFEKFFPQAKFTEGTLGIDVDIRGTWMKPLFDGEVKVEEVKGKVSPLPEAFEGFNGTLRFEGDKLVVEELSSKYGKGRASASGEVRFNGFIPSDLNIMVQTRRFYFESPAFEGLIDSHLQIGGVLTDPLISGEAVLNRARISIVSSKKIKRFDPRLNLRVRTGKDNYFRQFGLANLLVQGDLTIKGTMAHPVLEGIATSNRGVINLYGNSFRVTTAKAEFKPEDGYFPHIKAQAKTRANGVDIVLKMEGWTGGNLDFQFESSPDRSYKEIVELLNWSEMTEKGGLSLIQGNMNTVVDSVFGSVFDQFRDVLNMDFFTVEQDRIMGPLRLNMGKSFSDDLYLSYSRVLSEGSDDLWSLEYMFTPHLSLLGEYSDDDGTSIQLYFNFSF